MADWTKPFTASYRWHRVPRASYASSDTGLEGEQVTNVTGGRIEVNSDTQTFESASIDLVGPLDILPSDLLRCHLDATWEDGTTEDVVLGTFNAYVPSRTTHGSYDECSAILDGRLIELSDDAFEQPYVIPASSNPMYYVAQITNAAGIPWRETHPTTPVYSTTVALTYGLSAEDAQSKLDVICDLMQLVGFRSPQTDEYGRFAVYDPIDYDGPAVWSFVEGVNATFLSDATIERDASAVCNVVRAVYETPSATIVGVAVDSDPDSPYSTVNLGRRKVATYQYSDLVTLTAANNRAAELLERQQSVIHRVTIQHVWCGARVGDVVELDYPSAGISGKFAIRTQSISLTAGCLTTSELRRFERA